MKINQILQSMSFQKPMDFKFGPDGALYMIEWGSGFGGNNADSGIYRIDYVKGARPPIARASADKTDGPLPLTVRFSSEGSRDPDGRPITYAWDFDDDGTVDSTDPNPTHTYTKAGRYSAVLVVTNADGATGTASVPITAGNTRPTVTVEVPPDGAFFEFGDQVKYKVTVTDPEDGTIDCAEVQVQALLGHDSHGHPLDQHTGCEGVLQTITDGGHGTDDNLFYLLEATYTDHGAEGAGPLIGRDQVMLQPKRKQAEHFVETGRVADGTGTDTPGVQTETTSDPQGGGQNIGFIQDGDWWSFAPVNLTDITAIRLRAASNTSTGGIVQVRAGDPQNGQLVGSVDVPFTGGWQSFTDVTMNLTDPPTTSGPLYFVVRRPTGAANTYLINVNWVDFVGKGATENQRPEVTVSANPTSGTAPLKVDFTASATDPDGDAVTYKWNFGVAGAPRPTTAEASHTYTAPGTYRAAVTVTDARGAATTAQVSIKVDASSELCLSGGSDDFVGTDLDRDRWSVIRENQDLKVAGGQLVIPTSATDIYGTGGDTPNIVVQPAPSGAWTATTKVTLDARDAYQQAGLILYGDDDNYAKMVLQARATNNHADRIFQFIREENGNPNEVSQSNTAQLGDAYPDTVHVRFVSDGSNITAHYSADGVTFTAMPQTKPLAGIDNPRIGLLSLASSGNRPVVDANFDWFHIAPDDTATRPAPNDEFDGTSLDTCRWNAVVRSDPAGARVTGGNLEIDTSNGDIYGTGNSGPKNFILQTAPSGDWTLETKIDGSAFNEAYQQGGLIVYTGDDDYVKFDYITENAAGSAVARRIELRSEVGGVVQEPQPQVDRLTGGVWWLRLTKEGSTFRGHYSADGTTWTEIGVNGTPTAVRNDALADGRIGLFAFGGAQTASKTAKFDYFHVSEGASAPTVVISGVADGERYGDSQDLLIAWEAVDSGSGVKTVTGTLDGRPFTSQTRQPLYKLALGEHTLTVTAVSDTGGRTVQTVKFSVVTSTADISNLIDRFEAAGKLAPLSADRLHKQLDRVRDAENKDKTNSKIVEGLTRFRSEVNHKKVVSDDEVRTVLLRDTDALITQYDGTTER